MNYKTFHIATWNANGLRTKLADIEKLIDEADLDWVFICETRWEQKYHDPRNAVSNQIGRTVSSTNYGSMILTNRNKTLDAFEMLEVGLYGCYQIFRWRGALFMGVYISPSIPVEEEDIWIDRFIKCFSYKKHPDEVVVLLGDFNMRSGELTGDTVTCRRAKNIGSWLGFQDFEFAVQGPNESPRPVQDRYVDHAEQPEPEAGHAGPYPPLAMRRQVAAQREDDNQRHGPGGSADRRDLPVIALERGRDLPVWLGHLIRLAGRSAWPHRPATWPRAGTHHVTNTSFSRIGRGYRAAWHRWRTLIPAWPAPQMPTCLAIVRPAATRSPRNEFAGYTVSKSNERS